MPTLHRYDLNPTPFEMIRNQTKRYELRLYDEKRRLIHPNDEIEFTNNVTKETIRVNVISLHIFNHFKELYEYLDPHLLGYEKDEVADYHDMEEHYPSEKQKNSKVVAIKIALN